MNFNYKKLSEDILKTFQFGDTYEAKTKEIGITYNELKKMQKGLPVSVECVLSCLVYLDANEETSSSIGVSFDIYMEK